MPDLTPATQTSPAASASDGSGHEPLPDPIRVVLGSRQKLALLCLLDEGPMSSRDLSDRLHEHLQVKAINLHLKELENIGWISVVDQVRVPGGDRKIWGLTVPGWRALLDTIHAIAPLPPTASNDQPSGTSP